RGTSATDGLTSTPQGASSRHAPEVEVTNEEIVRRYCAAVATRDHVTAAGPRHRDWVCEWPQSGERVTSSANMRALIEAYPGGPWEAHERRLRGSEDQYVV